MNYKIGERWRFKSYGREGVGTIIFITTPTGLVRLKDIEPADRFKRFVNSYGNLVISHRELVELNDGKPKDEQS
jgi:hypothetical protein